jgi:Uma2 family endonuclease
MVRDAPGPTATHQCTVGDVYWKLRTHLEHTGAGQVWLSPIDVVLDRERGLVVQPDLVVVLNERLQIVSDRVWGAPDLVVEIMSPHPRIGRLEERLDWFAQYGVRECWLVLQGAGQIEVISFADSRIAHRRMFAPLECLRSEVLPAFNVTPGEMISVL